MFQNHRILLFTLSLCMIVFSQIAYPKSNSLDGEVVIVTVNGMVCDFCARGITKSLKKDPNVKNFTIDLTNKKVTIIFKRDKKLDRQDLRNILNKSGYSIRKIEYNDKKP